MVETEILSHKLLVVTVALEEVVLVEVVLRMVQVVVLETHLL